MNPQPQQGMQGYGQQAITQQQYAHALQAYDALKKRKDRQDAVVAQGNPFALLGAALGNKMYEKWGKFGGQNLSTVEQQIEAFQDQAKLKIEEAKEARKRREDDERWEKRYNRKRQDDLSDRQAGFANQKELMQYGASLRPGQQPTFTEQQFNQLPPEAQNAARMHMFGMGQKQTAFSPEIQAAVQTGAITPQQAQAAQREKALGSGQPSMGADARAKMGLLQDAEKSLAQYKQGAFSEDGDYKEFGSKFGATNTYLDNAVDNLLRFESGAAISDKERDQAMDKYSPSMWRSDETNMARVKLLEDKIKELKSSFGGQQQPQSQQPNMQQANNTYFKYSGGQ